MTKYCQSAIALAAFAFLTTPVIASTASVTPSNFGVTAGGTPITQYILTNTKGMTIKVINFGGILREVDVPDRDGKVADVTLGFDKLSEYEANPPYFGAIIGRYGNRIAKGTFTIDGNTYHAPINNAGNSLHGGKIGFNKLVWDAKPSIEDGEASVALHLDSMDGDQGYPGNIDVNVTYTLTNDDAIRITYNATSDADTVLNLTNHAYWNLDGQNKGKIFGTLMQLKASRFLPTDKTQIPTGTLKSVAGTPFDFRTPMTLGSRINENDPQLKIGSGYDHCWVLDKPFGTFGLAARAVDMRSGRVLSVYTDQPGIQLYTGNFLEGTPPGKGGFVYHKNFGFALETQHYPDSPNHPNFPTTELKAGQTYHTVTEYRFSTI